MGLIGCRLRDPSRLFLFQNVSTWESYNSCVNSKTRTPCCGSGSGIWAPGSGIRTRDVKNVDRDPGTGSGMNIPDNFSRSLETVFGLKILKSFIWIRNLFDPGSWMENSNPGSGTNMPNPQHCPYPLFKAQNSAYNLQVAQVFLSL